ncbi:HIT domain-containing protein [Methylophilus sp. DW102]|uniref:HIT family protein n=1 Tax=Methylophilus sp. DW102 TaxID=3095607 RepID=UPI00308E71A2|nr:HIT domain-containing protein [Methylophilus sp. DW102]
MSVDNRKDTDCRICTIVASKPAKAVDQILAENDNYFAVSSVGGFIPGWTLIFPKTHILNLSNDYSRSEFLSFAANVANVVSEEYGSCVAFEHGSNSYNSATSCGVHHAHMHLVPFSENIELLALQESEDLLWKPAQLDEIRSLANGGEYLFCSNSFEGLATKGIFAKLNSPKSQFFRKVLARATGFLTMYDYKQYKFNEVSEDTTQKLLKKFAMAAVAE